MRIYVFGAGASFDSQHDMHLSASQKAPLMRELFLDNYNEYALQVDLPLDRFAELRTLAGNDVEAYLTRRWNEIKECRSIKYQEAEKRLFARIVFYIWYLLLNISNKYSFGGTNTYNLFIRKIVSKDEDYGFINFNYDTFLDKAIKATYGNSFRSLEDYFSFDYIKPHGSVNWLMSPRVNEVVPSQSIFPGNFYLEPRYSEACNRMFTGSSIPYENIKVIDPNDPNLRNLNLIQILNSLFAGLYFYPLVFIPLTSKQYDSVATFNDKIMAKGIEMMERASEIYLIGYSASDQIIRDMLSHVHTGTRLHIVGRESSKGIIQRIMNEFEGQLSQGEIFCDGFSNFVHEL